MMYIILPLMLSFDSRIAIPIPGTFSSQIRCQRLGCEHTCTRFSTDNGYGILSVRHLESILAPAQTVLGSRVVGPMADPTNI